MMKKEMTIGEIVASDFRAPSSDVLRMTFIYMSILRIIFYFPKL